MRSIKIDLYIVDSLMVDLVGHDKRPSSYLVYLYLWMKTRGSKSEKVKLSYQTIANEIGLSKSAAQSSIGWLIRRKLVRMRKAHSTDTPEYNLLRPWIKKPAWRK